MQVKHFFERRKDSHSRPASSRSLPGVRRLEAARVCPVLRVRDGRVSRVRRGEATAVPGLLRLRNQRRARLRGRGRRRPSRTERLGGVQGLRPSRRLGRAFGHGPLPSTERMKPDVAEDAPIRGRRRSRR